MIEYLVGLPLALGAAYALGELGARAYLAATRRHYIWHPNTVTRLLIDQEAMPLIDPVAESRFNADGERVDPLPSSWDDTARVVVLGGSIAECYFLDQDVQWPAVVQRELNAEGAAARLGASRAYVGNIGRSLVSCEYMTRMLADTIHRYDRLDVVVIMCGASDVVHWIEKGTPDSIEGGDLPLSALFAQHGSGPFAWHPKRTALRRVVENALASLRPRLTVKEGAGRTMLRLRAMRANAKTWVDEVPDPAPMVAHFEEHFRALVTLAKSRAKRVVIARQPWFEKDHTDEEKAHFWNFGLGRPHGRELDTYYTHRVVDRLMHAVDDAQARLAAELGVEQIDLMPILEPSLETYYDTLHFTPHGADVAGRAIAKVILDGPSG